MIVHVIERIIFDRVGGGRWVAVGWQLGGLCWPLLSLHVNWTFNVLLTNTSSSLWLAPCIDLNIYPRASLFRIPLRPSSDDSIYASRPVPSYVYVYVYAYSYAYAYTYTYFRLYLSIS